MGNQRISLLSGRGKLHSLDRLVHIYKNNNKKTSKRIASYRDSIHDLTFNLKYLEGKQMPCDYGSRHPNTIYHLSKEEQEDLGFDMGKTIYVRKIHMSGSPDAINTTDIKQAALQVRKYSIKRKPSGKEQRRKISRWSMQELWMNFAL